MEKDDLNTTFWKGHFFYHLYNETDEMQKLEIPFLMQLKYNNGTIEGTRVDDETKNLIKEPIIVHGFLEKDFISFVVKYPYNYFIDEESNEVVFEKEFEHPDIHYQGEFDKKSNCYKGEWNMTIEEFRDGNFQNDFITRSLNGSWEMKKL